MGRVRAKLLSGICRADAQNMTSRTKKKNIYVISTAQRPVPLEHYLYANREIYKIVDAKRNFLAQG